MDPVGELEDEVELDDEGQVGVRVALPQTTDVGQITFLAEEKTFF